MMDEYISGDGKVEGYPSYASTWRDAITGYAKLAYPTKPNHGSWARASIYRFIEGWQEQFND